MVLGALALVAAAAWCGRFLWADRSSASPTSPQPAVVASVAAQPRAVVAQPTHDLGVLHPGDRRRHRFVVRNEGTADLTLSLGSTTCKCTLANLDQLRIPPGGSDVVELEWHAEDPQFRFRQGATINTNDPALPQFELIGEGSVRVKLGTQPESAYLADVPRNTARTLNVLLYSQAFTEVEIDKIESSTAAISAAISAEPPTTAPPVQETRFLRDLVVTLQPQTAPGNYGGVLRIAYRGRLPDAAAETGTYELPVAFGVIGDVTLHGRDVVGNLLTFGTVSQATGAAKQLYVHVRGAAVDAPALTVRRKTPEFLNVRFGEPQRLTPTIVRIPVTVAAPPGAPQCVLTEHEPGLIELATTDAEATTVRIDVCLAIGP